MGVKTKQSNASFLSYRMKARKGLKGIMIKIKKYILVHQLE